MYKALVIDDDPIFQYIAGKIFEKTNLFKSTDYFLNGQDALSFLEENKDNHEVLPDVILLDLYMPAFNGWEFLSAYDSIFETFEKKIPVYVLTSSIDPKEIVRSKTHPAVRAFTSKPMSYEFIESIYKDCELMAS